MDSIKLILEIPPAQVQLLVDRIAGMVAIEAGRRIEQGNREDVPMKEVEVKKLLGVSASTLRRYRDMGLRCTKVGRKISYRMKDINAFQEKHGSSIKRVYGK